MDVDQDASSKYVKKLQAKCSKLPLDAASYVFSYSNQYVKDLEESVTEQFCAYCSTPWRAGFLSSRLLPCPSGSKLNILLKRERKGRLSSLDKKLLIAAQKNENLQTVTCLRCKHKTVNSFRKPVKNKTVKAKVEEVVKQNTIKPKRKKEKERNAGLNLDALKTGAQQKKLKFSIMELKNSNKAPKTLDSDVSKAATTFTDTRATKLTKSKLLRDIQFKKSSLPKILAVKKKKTIVKIDRLREEMNKLPVFKPNNLQSFMDSLL